jgi:hypothetical protein
MRILLFLSLLTFCSAFALANSPVISKQQLLSKKPANYFDLKFENKELLVTVNHHGTKRMPTDRLTVWMAKERGYEPLYSFDSGIGETFEKPNTFTVDGFHFLNISTSPSGSGGFVQENILWIAPDNSIHPVDLQLASETYENLASPDEIILNGGEKEFFVQDNQMKFEFWLAHEGDPHCCPTAGVVTGTYKLAGKPKYDFFERKYTGKLEIQIDQFQYSSALTGSNSR